MPPWGDRHPGLRHGRGPAIRSQSRRRRHQPLRNLPGKVCRGCRPATHFRCPVRRTWRPGCTEERLRIVRDHWEPREIGTPWPTGRWPRKPPHRTCDHRAAQTDATGRRTPSRSLRLPRGSVQSGRRASMKGIRNADAGHPFGVYEFRIRDEIARPQGRGVVGVHSVQAQEVGGNIPETIPFHAIVYAYFRGISACPHGSLPPSLRKYFRRAGMGAAPIITASFEELKMVLEAKITNPVDSPWKGGSP